MGTADGDHKSSAARRWLPRLEHWVYNPDLDPDSREAKQIVAYLASVTENSGGAPR